MGSWKGFKGNHKAASEGCDSPPPEADAYTAAVATVVRAPPKDFRLVRQEWAAIRIQTAFRAFLVSSSFFLSILTTLFIFMYTKNYWTHDGLFASQEKLS